MILSSFRGAVSSNLQNSVEGCVQTVEEHNAPVHNGEETSEDNEADCNK